MILNGYVVNAIWKKMVGLKNLIRRYFDGHTILYRYLKELCGMRRREDLYLQQESTGEIS
jgi:hypothetical protein